MQFDWKQQYCMIVDFLGKALGPDFEIVLHDLSSSEHTILAIANGSVSGRKPSSPLSSLALSFILNKDYERQPYKLNYEGISSNGRKLKSSTFFIKDQNGTLLGMMCINFNAGKYLEFADAITNFVQNNYIFHDTSPELTENFTESTAQIYQSVIYKTFGEKELPEKLSQEQKLELIRQLNDCGVFMIKGSITEISELSKISVASIYRYLSQIKKADKST